MAGAGNETRSMLGGGRECAVGLPCARAASQNTLSGKLKSAGQGRIVGADRKRAAADCPSLHARGAASNRKKGDRQWKPSRRNRTFRIPSSTRHARNGTILRSIWSAA